MAKGFDYLVDLPPDVNVMALLVLQLVNIKSSRPGVVYAIKTFEGMYRARVVTYVEIDSTLESLGCMLVSKQGITLPSTPKDMEIFNK